MLNQAKIDALATTLAPTDLAMPEDLDEPGQRAWYLLVSVLARHGVAMPGTRVFYSPAEWLARGEHYGAGSHLVVTYDGAPDVRDACSLDTSDPRTRRAAAAALETADLYVEECTCWFAAVYPIPTI